MQEQQQDVSLGETEELQKLLSKQKLAHLHDVFVENEIDIELLKKYQYSELIADLTDHGLKLKISDRKKIRDMLNLLSVSWAYRSSQNIPHKNVERIRLSFSPAGKIVEHRKFMQSMYIVPTWFSSTFLESKFLKVWQSNLFELYVF